MNAVSTTLRIAIDRNKELLSDPEIQGQDRKDLELTLWMALRGAAAFNGGSDQDIAKAGK